jgi:hypothetical protein
MTRVVGVTSTVAGPLGLVSVIVAPDTAPTMPEVRSLPSAAGAWLDEVAAGDELVAGLLELLEAVDDVPDEPQPASDNAARPARVAAAQRDTRVDEVMAPPSAYRLPVRFDDGVRLLRRDV